MTPESPVVIHRIEQGRPPPPQVLAGAACYTPFGLSIYDPLVLFFENTFAWRCSTRALLEWYQTHVSSSHLEVGVGTGYYPDRCRFPSASPRIVLADLNPNSLQKTAQRVRRYRPIAYQLDVLCPFQLPEKSFGSIAMNYLLHCLPGTLTEKAVAFDHLVPWLDPGGVLFGSTILGTGVRYGWIGKKMLDFYNRKRILTNIEDTAEELESCLKKRFSRVELRLVGTVALFSARSA